MFIKEKKCLLKKKVFIKEKKVFIKEKKCLLKKKVFIKEKKISKGYQNIKIPKQFVHLVKR